MKVMIVAAPGPAKCVRRQLFYAPLGVTEVECHHTIGQARRALQGSASDLIIIVGPKSAKALAHLSRDVSTRGIPQLMTSGVDADFVLYQGSGAAPQHIPIPDSETAISGLIALAMQIRSFRLAAQRNRPVAHPRGITEVAPAA